MADRREIIDASGEEGLHLRKGRGMKRSLAMLVVTSTVLVATAVGSTALTASGAGSAQNYLVIYKSESVPATAAKTIQQAGGTLVYSYGQIGVALASSSSSSFT